MCPYKAFNTNITLFYFMKFASRFHPDNILTLYICSVSSWTISCLCMPKAYFSLSFQVYVADMLIV